MLSSEPRTIGIAGLGLIGGSVAKALCERRPAWRCVGYDIDAAAARAAVAQGCVAELASTIDELFRTCDLVVLCQPIEGVLAALDHAARLDRVPVICDVASVKAAVCIHAARVLGPRSHRFVGGHPIAGKAESGLAHSEARLFEGRPVVLCADGADEQALTWVSQLWRTLGAVEHRMGAREHDAVYAALSHTPQCLTWAYLLALQGQIAPPQLARLAGTGFTGFTRLGRSNPALWAAIAAHNRFPLVEFLDRVTAQLHHLREVLDTGSAQELRGLFEQGRAALDPGPAEPTSNPRATKERSECSPANCS